MTFTFTQENWFKVTFHPLLTDTWWVKAYSDLIGYAREEIVINEGHSQSADLIYLISEDVRDKQFCMPGVVGSTYGHHLVSWHTSVRNIIPKQMSYLDCGNCPKEVPLLIKLMVLYVQEVWNRPFTGDISVCLGVFGGWPIKHNKPKTWSLGLFCQVVVCVLV